MLAVPGPAGSREQNSHCPWEELGFQPSIQLPGLMHCVRVNESPGEEEPKCPRLRGPRPPEIPEVTSGENNSTLIPGSGCCFLSCGLAPLAAIGSRRRDSPGRGGCRDKDPVSWLSIYFQAAACLPVASVAGNTTGPFRHKAGRKLRQLFSTKTAETLCRAGPR